MGPLGACAYPVVEQQVAFSHAYSALFHIDLFSSYSSPAWRSHSLSVSRPRFSQEAGIFQEQSCGSLARLWLENQSSCCGSPHLGGEILKSAPAPRPLGSPCLLCNTHQNPSESLLQRAGQCPETTEELLEQESMCPAGCPCPRLLLLDTPQHTGAGPLPPPGF